MSASRLETIDRVIRRGITAGGYPGAAVVVGRRGAAVWEKGFGRLGWSTTSSRVVADQTIYDLASLTKVVGTTTAAMILYDEGKLDLDQTVSRYLPRFRGGLKDRVTVRQLLAHRGGLPAGRELWRYARTPEEARQLVFDVPLEYRPGTGQVYSDLGADLLGWVIEKIAGQGLDVFLKERVFEPLGMDDTGFRPDRSLVARIAPTEVTPPRGYAIRGEVHDENAYLLGGVAGHAGLFGTAGDVAVFAQMILNGGIYDGVRIVSDSAVRLFTARASGTRALGWEMGDADHGAGVYFGARAFGHTGYTGTSLWIDPEREMFVVLLTNRVHAARVRRPSKVIADVRADLADAAALAVTDEAFAVSEMPSMFRADLAVGWNRPFRARRTRGSSVKRAKPVATTKVVASARPLAAKATPAAEPRKAPVTKAPVTKAPVKSAAPKSATPTPTKKR